MELIVQPNLFLAQLMGIYVKTVCCSDGAVYVRVIVMAMLSDSCIEGFLPRRCLLPPAVGCDVQEKMA